MTIPMKLAVKAHSPRTCKVALVFDLDGEDLPRGRSTHPSAHFSMSVSPEEAEAYIVGAVYNMAITEAVPAHGSQHA